MINQIKKELGALEVQMINALNLIWIIPLCLLLGGICTVIFVSSNTSNRESDIYQEGKRDGYRIALIEFEDKNND